MTENESLPELTSESLVTLAVATSVPPSPLVLTQLGFAIETDVRSRQIAQVVDRGARALKSLQAFAPENEEWGEMLRQSVLAIGSAQVFIILIRSDNPEARVVYLGEECVVDVMTPYGNHRLQLNQDAVKDELGTFFGDCSRIEEDDIVCPLDRFQTDPIIPDDEGTLITRLASDDAVDHMVTICSTAEVKFEILKWRSVDDRLFTISNQDNQVAFASTGSSESQDEVLGAVQRVQEV